MAITKAAMKAIWLQGLIEDLRVVQKQVNVYCDSQSAIHLAKDQVFHEHTKHIDVKHHFVQEIIENEKILL